MESRQPYPGMPSASPIDVDRRAAFITRTYVHLFGAILAFAAFEVVLFKTGAALKILTMIQSVSWLVILGAFMIVSWLASRGAAMAKSREAQYLALGAFVVAEGLIFVPLLYSATYFAPGVLDSAVAVTLLGFGGLTLVAFTTRKDFSFLGALLRWVGVLALVLIVASVLFGFQLGTFFSVGMVAFAGAAVLYDTSNVIHHYPEDREVAAALQLFASVALMFWYVLRLFLSRD